jgi:hypothetical protein
VGVKNMVSAAREPIVGVWGRGPSGVQEQRPWSGGQGTIEAPPKLLILSLYFDNSLLQRNIQKYKHSNTSVSAHSVNFHYFLFYFPVCLWPACRLLGPIHRLVCIPLDKMDNVGWPAVREFFF